MTGRSLNQQSRAFARVFHAISSKKRLCHGEISDSKDDCGTEKASDALLLGPIKLFCNRLRMGDADDRAGRKKAEVSR